MRIFGRVIQLICGLVMLVGFAWGFVGAGIFGIFVVIWALKDIYNEMNPDTDTVSSLDDKISSLTDNEEAKEQEEL